MTLATDITTVETNAAITLIRSLLQEQDPTLDLSVGGAVDSLLVAGNALVAARNGVEVNKAYLYQQLKAIAERTVVVEDADLDALMANYFLTRKQTVLANGTVVFVVRDSRAYVFGSDYRLTANGQTYIVPETYSVYPPATAGIDFSVSTNIAIEQVYDSETGYTYRFQLPVEAEDEGPQALLVSGDRLVPDQGFSGLGYVQALTNFAGGTVLETNSEFAARGLEGVLAYTVGGNENINKIASTVYPQAMAATVGTGSELMTRDRDNVFNLPTGGKIDVYVKSGAIAAANFTVTAEVLDPVTRTLKVTLTRAQSAGVYKTTLSPYFTTTPPTGTTGAITIVSTAHASWVSGGFDPQMPAAIDRAFSTHQEIVIIFTDTRKLSGGAWIVTLTIAGELITGAYQIATEYQPGALEVADVMLSDSVRPPGTDVLVKAAVPCIVNIGLNLVKSANYNGPEAEELAADISYAINQLPIGTAYLDAYSLSRLINNIVEGLTISGLSMNGTIYGQDDVDVSLSTVDSKLTIPTSTSGKFAGVNCYFTTTYDLVTVTLV